MYKNQLGKEYVYFNSSRTNSSPSKYKVVDSVQLSNILRCIKRVERNTVQLKEAYKELKQYNSVSAYLEKDGEQ